MKLKDVITRPIIRTDCKIELLNKLTDEETDQLKNLVSSKVKQVLETFPSIFADEGWLFVALTAYNQLKRRMSFLQLTILKKDKTH